MANDALEALAERIFFTLARLQDHVGDGSHESFLPRIAASHFAGHFATAGWANRCGLHAVSLGTARQAFEALSVIEVGLLGAAGTEQLLRWEKGGVTAGGLRKWLETHAWPDYPPGIRGVSWSAFMLDLGRALQPYAHFSPQLLQWNMNVVQAPGGATPWVVAIGPSSYDAARAARIQLLRATLLWALGTVTYRADAELLALQGSNDLGELRQEIERSEWLISSDWEEVLIPHVWDADSTE